MGRPHSHCLISQSSLFLSFHRKPLKKSVRHAHTVRYASPGRMGMSKRSRASAASSCVCESARFIAPPTKSIKGTPKSISADRPATGVPQSLWATTPVQNTESFRVRTQRGVYGTYSRPDKMEIQTRTHDFLLRNADPKNGKFFVPSDDEYHDHSTTSWPVVCCVDGHRMTSSQNEYLYYPSCAAYMGGANLLFEILLTVRARYAYGRI